MGSFPNKTAANILKLLFTDKGTSSTTAPTMYTSGTSSAGIYAPAGSVPLYIGLIDGNFANQTAGTTLEAALTDATIISAGAGIPVVTSGGNALSEYTGSGNGTTRQAIVFNTVTNIDDNSANKAQVQGPSATVQFGTATVTQTTRSVIGFFITTLATGTNPSALPTVVAYGHLSSSRSIQSGDQPTFASGAITITLD